MVSVHRVLAFPACDFKSLFHNWFMTSVTRARGREWVDFDDLVGFDASLQCVADQMGL